MIMKSVSFTIICEIGNVIQINERFLLIQNRKGVTGVYILLANSPEKFLGLEI